MSLNYTNIPGVTYREKPTSSLAFNKLTLTEQNDYNSAPEGSSLRETMDLTVNTMVEQIYQTRRREDEANFARAERDALQTAFDSLTLSDNQLLVQLQETAQNLATKTTEAAQAAALAQSNGEQLSAAQQQLIDDAAAAATALATLQADEDAQQAALTAERDAATVRGNAALAALKAVIGGGTDDDANFQ